MPLLRWGFRSGETIACRLFFENRFGASTLPIQGWLEATLIDMTVAFGDSPEEDTVLVEPRIDRVRGIVKPKDRPALRYDTSREDLAALPPRELALNGYIAWLAGASFSTRLSRLGVLGEVSLPPGLLERLGKAPPLIRSALEPHALKEYVPTFMLPKREARAGSAWTVRKRHRSSTMGEYVSLERYTYAGPGSAPGPVADILLAVELDPQSETNSAKSFDSMTGSGLIQFDHRTGRMLSYRCFLDFKQKKLAPEIGVQGAVDIRSAIRMTFPAPA